MEVFLTLQECILALPFTHRKDEDVKELRDVKSIDNVEYSNAPTYKHPVPFDKARQRLSLWVCAAIQVTSTA